MNSTPANVPLEKHVVLVGAGNAHLGFVRRFGMNPIRAVAVTLVSESAVIPYSAMVPGYIARDYAWDEISIDLVRLCQASHVRFLAQRVLSIDPIRRFVHFPSRPPIAFDALSLGVGSLPACPESLKDDERSMMIRPMSLMTQRLDAIDADLAKNPRRFRFVVIGGGASGCELSVAIVKRFGKYAGFTLTLLQGDARLLPEFPESAARSFEHVFQERKIESRTNARVVDAADGALILQDGQRVPFDAVLWATQAAPTPLLRDSGLAVDARGFLKVTPTLQTSDAAIFGTGDCVDFEAYPTLQKNGVHAVRQGDVLFDNIAAFLHERPLRPFEPQRYCLCLMNTADGNALLNYGPFTWMARWVRKWKDRIDRRWIAMHSLTSSLRGRGAGGEGAVPQEESPLMRCGGCGNKISADVLSAVLRRIDIPDDPRILLGTRAGEDAAVHRVRPELFGDPQKLLEVQTVDYFKAFVDDPYLFGRIAALNAVSDLYAMNARPFTALAIATLPYARGPIQEAQLYELLSGAVESLKELGVTLTGGHTTEGPELALGFAVTGFAEDGKLFQKSNLQVGDRLILTKPLGSGALLAAWMRGECKAAWFEPLIAKMLTSNAAAGKIFADAGVTACTDVTGFGLAGHLLEMLDGSKVSARLFADRVPVYDGFNEVVERGIVSTLHRDNAKASCRVIGAAAAWLFDPQTSGGLIAGVKPDAVVATLASLHQAGYDRAVVIGEIVAGGQDPGPSIHLASP
jgi:selenide,water dikinase